MSDDQANFDAFKWECRRKQIESLRVPWEGMGDMANAERAIAALTIDNLMAEVEAWRQAMQKAERDIKELRDALEIEKDAVNHLHTDRNNLRLEIDRMVDKLAAQRDEARREVCELLYNRQGGWPKEHATERGWDCFKEKP